VIVAAGLLVLLGLGLFVAGILTGVTVLYWACVAVCVVAAVLLLLVRRQTGRTTSEHAKATQSAATATGTAPERAAPADAAAQSEKQSEERLETAARVAPAATEAAEQPDPGVEEVEVTDLLLVVDLKDVVLVVDEHPRYHLAECTWLAGRETIPLPLDEARSDGFTPCAVCSPDRNLAERARAAK
jgi:hypothetical protein